MTHHSEQTSQGSTAHRAAMQNGAGVANGVSQQSEGVSALVDTWQGDMQRVKALPTEAALRVCPPETSTELRGNKLEVVIVLQLPAMSALSPNATVLQSSSSASSARSRSSIYACDVWRSGCTYFIPMRLLHFSILSFKS